mmetsp:Transcript_117214/g.373360  ORF Transcript_117214/g.373360 Transcript_117214/m.373360 type:complete len:234 (+) Transcript_117214:1630-2331(+)
MAGDVCYLLGGDPYQVVVPLEIESQKSSGCRGLLRHLAFLQGQSQLWRIDVVEELGVHLPLVIFLALDLGEGNLRGPPGAQGELGDLPGHAQGLLGGPPGDLVGTTCKRFCRHFGGILDEGLGGIGWSLALLALHALRRRLALVGVALVGGTALGITLGIGVGLGVNLLAACWFSFLHLLAGLLKRDFLLGLVAHLSQARPGPTPRAAKGGREGWPPSPRKKARGARARGHVA